MRRRDDGRICMVETADGVPLAQPVETESAARHAFSHKQGGCYLCRRKHSEGCYSRPFSASFSRFLSDIPRKPASLKNVYRFLGRENTDIACSYPVLMVEGENIPVRPTAGLVRTSRSLFECNLPPAPGMLSPARLSPAIYGVSKDARQLRPSWGKVVVMTSCDLMFLGISTIPYVSRGQTAWALLEGELCELRSFLLYGQHGCIDPLTPSLASQVAIQSLFLRRMARYTLLNTR